MLIPDRSGFLAVRCVGSEGVFDIATDAFISPCRSLSNVSGVAVDARTIVELIACSYRMQ